MMKKRRFRRWPVLCCLILMWSYGSGIANETPSETADFLQALQSVENRLLKSHPVSGASPALRYFGEDPYRIERLKTSDRYLVLLRNSSEVLLCDSTLNILDRRSAPRSPVAWDLVDEKWLFVGGEFDASVRVYAIGRTALEPVQSLSIQDAVSIRDLVYLKPFNAFYILDDSSRRLIWMPMAPDWLDSGASSFDLELFPLGAGPLSIHSAGDNLVINLLLDHRLLILPLVKGRPDFKNATHISNAGPFWGVDVGLDGERLIIAAGGVEDRPLNRLGGEFGYVDSYLYLFVLHREGGRPYQWKREDRTDPKRFQAVNLSEHGIITPKAVRFQPDPAGGRKLWVSGFGGERFAEFRIQDFRLHLHQTWTLEPGITDFVIRSDSRTQTAVTVSPLLDRVTIQDLDGRRQLQTLAPAVSDPMARSKEIRIGELLFFTTLLTPSNRTDGELSRFTCETCHFEGTLDGRTHFTGRDDIHATSKTLRGLADNVPLFSRAGSASLAAMVMAEFEVANQERKDRFTVRPGRYPFLSDLGELPAVLSPLYLRQSFLEFFTAFGHRPNPWRVRYKRLDDRSKKGLEVFRRRCEDCHQAIETTRHASAVSFKNWEAWLTEEHLDLVWGAPFLCKTGIRPYPDPAGTRVPSLRRVWYKYPYFTNGSARNLRDVLRRFRYRGATAWHHYDGVEKDLSEIRALTPAEIEALEAVLKFF